MNKRQLRVLTYNIHKGFPTYRRRYVLDHIKNAIHSVGADLVFLQEIMGHHPKEGASFNSFTSNQFEYIADSAWPHLAYGKNAVYSEGNHGNAILSKYPLLRWENIDISNSKLEKRGILHGVVRPKGFAKELHLLCVHLDLLEKGRRLQLMRIAERIGEAIPDDEPLVLAGDFNDWRRKASDALSQVLGLREVHRACHGSYARTFPCWLPVLSLDRIYVRGLEIEACQVLRGGRWRRLSDHAALFTKLHL